MADTPGFGYHRAMPRPPALGELSIVLPCHDEAENVESVVRAACAAGAAVAGRWEVVVVDDGSRDGTGDRVRGLMDADDTIRLVTHPQNQGYGAALRSGFRNARYAQVFYTDGDGQFDLAQLERFVGAGRGANTVLAGYRHPRRDSLLRSLNGRSWSALANVTLGLGVRDVNCAFKLFPRELLAATPLSSRGAAIDAEILAEARRLGYPIAEAPVVHRPREHGRQSGARPAVIARALVELIRLRRRQLTR
tara:strand:- start:5135 stop:5884 length:750 start_codon:yes stop_codon:yes gene_type:complete